MQEVQSFGVHSSNSSEGRNEISSKTLVGHPLHQQVLLDTGSGPLVKNKSMCSLIKQVCIRGSGPWF